MSGLPRSVLFVCTGNICRSPLAEGIFRARVNERGWSIETDSAGTHGYHVGEPPDRRACAVARRRGIPIDALRARQVSEADFDRFERILVADQHNLRSLRQQFGERAGKAELLLPGCGIATPCEVPDPYYGDDVGFERVFDLLDGALRSLLQHWAKTA